MHNDEILQSKEEDSILSVIQSIKDGTINPKTLSKEDRQRCVELLIGEGYTEAQTAQILVRSEKTVSRDLVDIRKKNAIAPDVEIAKQIVGDVYQKGLAHHRYLMRLARSPEATHAEKAQSEFLAWRVYKELAEKLQTLGYLPMKAQAMVSDIYHHHKGGDTRTYQDLKSDLQDIERVARETGTLDPKTQEGIKLLQQRIEKAEIVEEVSGLAKDKDGQPKNTEVANEQ